MSSKKKIAILGSTGSIGSTSLKIINLKLSKYKIELLCAKENTKLLFRQIKQYLPRYVLISDYKSFIFLKKKKYKKKIIFLNNLSELNIIKKKSFDITIHGISGIDGLMYSFAFLKISKKILLANKESIVCGGNYFLKKSKMYNCKIISIDSEHYCLSNLLSTIKKEDIKTIYLTASGGPFLNTSINKIKKINNLSAINHPKWSMGKKISVDSATMVNKIFEVIEAHYLFGFNFRKIKIKIHEQAKIHCILVLKNGLVYFLGHNTSMTIPIQNCLDSKLNINNKYNFIENKSISLSFDEKKLKKFKIVNFGYKIMKLGSRAMIIFNVINDYLVYKYLCKKIFFYEIEKNLLKSFNNTLLLNYCKKNITNLNDIYETINFAKNFSKKIF